MNSRENETESNRLAARLARYASVGTGLGSTAARVAAGRLFRTEHDTANEARLFRETLGTLKGPLMKVAQFLATVPDILPTEYAEELAKLQAHAPAMGWPFVRRRMAAELGAGWQAKFQTFEPVAARAASLGQVHRAESHEGLLLACKLQYPDMDSAVEADLSQLRILFSVHRRLDPAIDTTEIAEEISARLREELDYEREAKHMALYREMLCVAGNIRVPLVVSELSTRRLLTMTWLDGEPLLTFKQSPLDVRNLLARSLFTAWWLPFCRYGVIHGDPHLGNYTAFHTEGMTAGLNLLDYGCIRIFPPAFTGGVVDLYRGLQSNDRAQIVHAYETWGFRNLSQELIDVLNVWAKFIYGPLLNDRVQSIAEGVSPAAYGRKQAFSVHQALKRMGPVLVPREFVFMDRAAIGLGGVFIHLKAELNFYRLFNEALEGFSVQTVAERQIAALMRSGLRPMDAGG